MLQQEERNENISKISKLLCWNIEKYFLFVLIFITQLGTGRVFTGLEQIKINYG